MFSICSTGKNGRRKYFIVTPQCFDHNERNQEEKRDYKKCDYVFVHGKHGMVILYLWLHFQAAPRVGMPNLKVVPTCALLTNDLYPESNNSSNRCGIY
jgi:hypothetical protein